MLSVLRQEAKTSALTNGNVMLQAGDGIGEYIPRTS
jgi:hypothetical protein